MNTNKGFAPIIAIIIGVIIIAGGIGGYLYIKKNIDNKNKQQEFYRDSRRAAELDAISSSIKLWILDNGIKLKCVKGEIYDSIQGTAAIDGTGWIPINFNEIPGGSLFSELYKDPLNNGQYHYSFACDPQTGMFEVIAKVESARWKEIYGNKDLMIFGTQQNLIP